MNSEGKLCSYSIFDIGKYDNVEIKGAKLDDFLKRIDEYVNEAYSDKLINYTIGKRGPRYAIYEENMLEMTIPIEIKIRSSEGIEYSTAEEIVFELN